MLRYLRNKWLYLVFILASMIAEPAVGSYLLLLLNRFYSNVEVGTSAVLILRMLLLGVLIWVGKRLISFVSGLLRNAMICHLRNDMKNDIFSSLLHLRGMEQQESGDYISALTNDITLIEQRGFEQVLSLMGNIFSIVILGGSFVSLDPALGGAVLIFGLTVAVVPALFQRQLAKKSAAFSAALGKFTGRVKELITAFPTVKNFGAEEVARRRFEQSNALVEGRSFDASFALSVGNHVAATLSWFMQIICIGAGLILVARGQIVMATLIAALGFTEDLAMPLGGIVSGINSLLSTKGVMAKITALCTGQRESEQRDLPQGDVSFCNMSLFASGRYIVKDFSYTFEKGKKYLVLGQNGSGKTSVFCALKKRFERYEGDIFVGDCDVRTLSSAALSRRISYLCAPVLFCGTVRQNVGMFRSYGDAEYRRAVRRAHLQLPAELVVEESGKNLSCGERQRVELARSLLSGADVLILDEFAANLDLLTAHDLEEELLGYEETVIHISHRPIPSLMERYDDILIMENGRLTAHGTVEELKKCSSYFRKLYDVAIQKQP